MMSALFPDEVVVIEPPPVIKPPFDFAQNIVDMVIEISTPGYIRPTWMNDVVYDSILLAAEEQRGIIARRL
jgi:hypothetical protein